MEFLWFTPLPIDQLRQYYCIIDVFIWNLLLFSFGLILDDSNLERWIDLKVHIFKELG